MHPLGEIDGIGEVERVVLLECFKHFNKLLVFRRNSDWEELCIGEWNVHQFVNSEDLGAALPRQLTHQRCFFDQNEVGACDEVDLAENAVKGPLVGSLGTESVFLLYRVLDYLALLVFGVDLHY